jgi:hypothetical protein
MTFGHQIKENKMGWACRAHGGMRNEYILIEKLEGKRPDGKPRRKIKDDIKINRK